MRAEPVVIAQLTDTHVSVGDHGPGVRYWAENGRRLRSAVRALNEETERPAVVVGTGDLVECGQEAAYAELMTLLEALQVPFWPVPGNHDSPARLRATFPDMPWADGHASWSQTIPGTDVTIIGLDSTDRGRAGGFVDHDRLEWLSDRITEASGPTIVAMHHPPFMTGIDWMDAHGFENLHLLEKVFHALPPTRIIAGHYHRSITCQVGPVAASVGLATAPHVHLDLSNAAVPAIINDPIGYQLHCVLDGEPHQVITHIRYVDRATVPRPVQPSHP